MKGIKILGAGLSGLTAAINLAKNGYNVEVFELREDCGKRFHGDLEGLENWSSRIDILDEIKSMNIELNFEYSPFKKMVFTDGEEKICIESKEPLFYLVKRGAFKGTLDQTLKKQAIESGVNIHFKVKKPPSDPNIIATGPIPGKATAVAKGIRFETDYENIAIALVNKKTSYKGYSYLLVDNNYGCMCTVCAYGYKNINRYFENTLKTFKKLTNLNIKNPKKVGGVGTFLIIPRLKKGDKIYVGEAAGLQDLLWGFGMRYAITSGFLAAKSITENISYSKLVKRKLIDKHRASMINRFFIERVDDYGKILLEQSKKLKSKESKDIFYKTYNLTPYGKLFYPLAFFTLLLRYRKIMI
jgi:flavin-dependent dehydrogenase